MRALELADGTGARQRTRVPWDERNAEPSSIRTAGAAFSSTGMAPFARRPSETHSLAPLSLLSPLVRLGLIQQRLRSHECRGLFLPLASLLA